MNLQTYIDLYQLLRDKGMAHAETRAFALERALPGKQPEVQLLAWVDAHRSKLSKQPLSEVLCRYLYMVSVVLGLVALLLGFLTGVGLLSYSGKEPVNVIYFLAVAVIIPLFTMLLALFSMWRAGSRENILVHISPAFWMERVISRLFGEKQTALSELQFNPSLLNWLVIKRAQLLALLFALGLLLALLGIVATKDIAFAWSTTLQISAEQFHTLLESLALPWSAWFPSAVPSLELIEKSHYFRLGGKLDSGMVTHAYLLGEWWKFLACATLFYAVFLRLLVWLLAQRGFAKALSKSLLALEGTERLLYEMETPMVTTTAPVEEKAFAGGNSDYTRIVSRLAPAYPAVLGWAMDEEGIRLLNDSMGIETEYFDDVGGSNTLEEDSRILQMLEGEVLLYVKSWEPPTMDIVDFLHQLAEKVPKVTVVPIGTVSAGYRPKPKMLDIWCRKLATINHPRIWLWQNS